MTGEFAEPSRQRRRFRPATILLIAGGSIIVLLALVFCAGLYLSDRQIKVELAKIRAAGEPITLTDLEAFYSFPADTHDATDLWMKAVAETDSEAYKADANTLIVGKFTSMMPVVNQSWPLQAEAEQFLLKYAGLLQKVHNAAAMGGAARFPTRFEEDPGNAKMTLFQSRLTLHIGALLLLEAKTRAYRGDAHAAANSVCALFALAHSLDHSPFFVSLFQRRGSDSTAVDCFERLLAVVDFSDSDLTRIDKGLAAIDYHDGFRRAVLGERVYTMQIFGHPDVLGGKAPTYGKLSVFRQADFAVYLQLMHEFTTASSSQNVSSLRRAMNQAQQHVDEVVTAPGASWRYRTTTLLSPFFAGAVDAVCRGVAKRDVARVAIAAERFRRARGRLPTELDELVPDFIANVPTDPFSGAPLKWRITHENCRIYSVGPDGADQAGREEQPNVAGDVVFRLSIDQDGM